MTRKVSGMFIPISTSVMCCERTSNLDSSQALATGAAATEVARERTATAATKILEKAMDDGVIEVVVWVIETGTLESQGEKESGIERLLALKERKWVENDC